MMPKRFLVFTTSLASVLNPLAAQADCRDVIERHRERVEDQEFVVKQRRINALVGAATVGAAGASVAAFNAAGTKAGPAMLIGGVSGGLIGALSTPSRHGRGSYGEWKAAGRLIVGAGLGTAAGAMVSGLQNSSSRGQILGMGALSALVGGVGTYIASTQYFAGDDASRFESPKGIPGLDHVSTLIGLTDQIDHYSKTEAYREDPVFRRLADRELGGRYDDSEVLKLVRLADRQACVKNNQEVAPTWERFVGYIRDRSGKMLAPAGSNPHEFAGIAKPAFGTERSVALSTPAESASAAR